MALINLDLNEGETLILAKPANHIKRIESVGGKFFITNQRVAFRSHIFNIQTHLDSISFGSIKNISFYNVLGIMPTGLKLHLEDGKVEKFVISKRAIVKEEIEKQIALQ